MGNTFSSIQICNTSHISLDIAAKQICDAICKQGLVQSTEKEYDLAYRLHISPDWVTVCASHWMENPEVTRSETANIFCTLQMPILSVFVSDSDAASIEFFERHGKFIDHVRIGVSELGIKSSKTNWSAVLKSGVSAEQFESKLRASYDSAEAALMALAPCFGINKTALLSSFVEDIPGVQYRYLYFKRKIDSKQKRITIKAAFKEIFGNALKPLGFVYPKLNQPYYIRMVGDDILHIIGIHDMKTHLILFGGIATVYRETLCLDRTFRQNENWLKTAMYFYVKEHETNQSFEPEIQSGFHYNQLIKSQPLSDAVQRALDAAITWILPVLGRVQTLKDAVDYDSFYLNNSIKVLPLPLNQSVTAPYNDGAIRFLLDDPLTDLEQRNETALKRINDENVFCHRTPEVIAENHMHYQRMLEESRRRLHLFLYNDEMHRQTLVELTRRKTHNIELLRKYEII